MDEEGFALDIIEAKAKATAATCVQVTMIAMLVNKGVLTQDDAATIYGIAGLALAESTNSEQEKELGKAVLSGAVKSVLKLIQQH